MATSTKPTVSSFKFKSVDGTGFSILADSFSDYFLQPAFLRFFFAAIGIYMLVDDDLYRHDASLWKIAGIWLGAVGIILTWFWIGFELLRALRRRGLSLTIYTPVALVPLVVLIEAAGLVAERMVTGVAWPGLSTSAEAVVLNIAVILLYDILHAHFVAPAHPHGTAALAQTPAAAAQSAAHKVQIARHPTEAEDAAEEPGDTAEAAAPAASASIAKIGPVATILRVGTKHIDIEDILMVRTEDHYLGIVTRTGKTLQRAKLSDLPELHASRLGMQINRSVWVAFAAIREMTENDRGQITLKLVTGDEEVVAKPRVFAFRQFYRPDAA